MKPEIRKRAGTARASFGRINPDGPEVVRRLLRRRCAALAAAEAFAGSVNDDPLPHDPDVVGAIVLLGLALATRNGLFDRMESAAPVLIVEVPQQDWIDPMAEALIDCFGQARPSSSDRRGARLKCDTGTGIVVVTASAKIVLAGCPSDRRTAQAFREQRPLIGVASSTHEHLPGDLLRACEDRLVVGSFDPEAVDLVVEHVVGCRPSRSLVSEVASAVEAGDLRVAVHSARGADGSVERLSDVVKARMSRRRIADGPRLQDLAGYGAAAEWGMGAAADLAAYAQNALPWTACDPGALLVGPPGTGKTIFAHALACQAGVPLLAGSLAQWQSAGEAHLGTTLKAMRDYFDAARKSSPCVALIDELDSFGDRSCFAAHHRHYSVQVVNGLLECLDGSEGRDGVLLVGTTNNRDLIDSAVLRSGRFDRCITISLPGVVDLAAILRHHLGGDLRNIDLMKAARCALGGTGADCAAWVRRARAGARRANRAVTIADLLREIGGSAATGADDKRAAVHESGHAVVAHALGFRLREVELHSTSEIGGMTGLRFRSRYATRDSLCDLLTVYLAGRAAEMIVYGAPSMGAATDLAEATTLCRNMHCSWGLGGRIAADASNSVPKAAAAAIERDLRKVSRVATSILLDRRNQLEGLAHALLERRALDGSEVEALLQGLARH
ncbi:MULTISPECIES: AAA family ATPase [Methylobacteriaceae]|uniref:AAA family ATPase n=1 Tax=Methylobacteriaceae TaxID=119045 RepID=UPI00074F94FE|nr:MULTISPECIES: AAA family ATPase [Methylobacteriaceae]AMB44808.1 ATPase [Methylobacterium sp. AMS5]